MKKSILFISSGIIAFSVSACSPDPSISYGYGREDYIKQDYQDAFHHFLEAAKWRNADAQYAVAYMYYYGIGVKQNLPNALFWMTKSANSGNKTAQAVLPAMNAEVPNLLFMDGATAARYASEPAAITSEPAKQTKTPAKLTMAPPVKVKLSAVLKTKHSTS